MAVEFKNKKISFDFDHSDGEVKLSGSINIDDATKNVTNLSGGVYKIGQETEGDTRIGDFNLMSISLYNTQYVTYRTQASQLIDAVLSDAMAQVSSLV